MNIEVTDVKIKVAEEDDDKLLGYCSLTLNDAFVIKDLKLIRGEDTIFVAMPSRKIADKCPRCGFKNHLRAKFCNECGNKLNPNRAGMDARGRAKLHFDLVHPIRPEVREYVHKKVIEAYETEKSRNSPVTPHSDGDDI